MASLDITGMWSGRDDVLLRPSTGRTVLLVALVLGGIAFTACQGSPAAPASGAAPPTTAPSSVESFLDLKAQFERRIATLGSLHVVDFEDVDASPVTDTIQGRPPFDGLRYTPNGFAFSNPNHLSLYVAPRGLAWNPSNSLSVGRFPFDPLAREAESPFIEDDDLLVSIDSGCSAVGFSLIDNDTDLPGETVVVITADGLSHQFTLPRTHLGVVSTARPIVRFLISEAADDYDDVTYDDFVCVR